MTAAARLVLEDCRRALHELRSCPAEDAHGSSVGPLWRCRWVAAVALLRAVGHVLHKIDAPNDPALRAAAERAHAELKRTKPEPAIYWGFIEEERNVVLKQYEFRIGMRISGNGSAITAAEYPSGNQVSAVAISNEDVQLNFFGAGPFAGRSQTHVAAEAIDWWQHHLDSIDARGNGGGPEPETLYLPTDRSEK